MKKYVHVWFVLIAVFLAVLVPATVSAHSAPLAVKPNTTSILDEVGFNLKLSIADIMSNHRTSFPESPSLLKVKSETGSAIDSIEELIAKHQEIDNMEKLITLSLNPKVKPVLFQTGTASWYGPRFYGRKTASGEVFTKHALTAAHRTLPFGTKIRVTNERTGKSVVVKVNDRGPFSGNRVLDLSHAAADAIGMIESGLCKVKIEKI